MKARQSEEAPAIEADFPDIDEGFSSILELFFLSGQASSTGIGLVCLTWQEIEAFIRVNSLELTLWEIEVLRKMSEAYAYEYSKASDPQRPSPFMREKTEENTEEENIKAALKMMNALSRFKNRGK